LFIYFVPRSEDNEGNFVVRIELPPVSTRLTARRYKQTHPLNA